VDVWPKVSGNFLKVFESKDTKDISEDLLLQQYEENDYVKTSTKKAINRLFALFMNNTFVKPERKDADIPEIVEERQKKDKKKKEKKNTKGGSKKKRRKVHVKSSGESSEEEPT